MKQSGTIGRGNWSKAASIEEGLEHLFPVQALVDMLSVAWGLKKGSKILHVGSASGRMVALLRTLGYDAIGIHRLARSATAPEAAQFNLLNEFTALPFDDHVFDAVVETALCRLPEREVGKAIEEIRRVTKHGVVLGSRTTDLAIDLLERHALLEDVQTLGSRWDWAERFHAAGFVHALTEPSRLDEAWKIAAAAGAGAGHWYEDPESLIYGFYNRRRARASCGDADEITESGRFLQRSGVAVPQKGISGSRGDQTSQAIGIAPVGDERPPTNSRWMFHTRDSY